MGREGEGVECGVWGVGCGVGFVCACACVWGRERGGGGRGGGGREGVYVGLFVLLCSFGPISKVNFSF